MKLVIPAQIETERLALARLKYEEAEEIFYTYASKPEATKYMSWPTHTDLKDTRAFLNYAVSGWNAGTDYSFGIRLKQFNRFIGSCGLLNDQGKVQFPQGRRAGNFSGDKFIYSARADMISKI